MRASRAGSKPSLSASAVTSTDMALSLVGGSASVPECRERGPTREEAGMALSLESSSIREGERIGDAYAFGVLTPDGPAPAGGNRSPHLRWSGAPQGTQSYAVLVVDPDVPVDTSEDRK